MFEAIEEGAIFLNEKFDCKLQGAGNIHSYDITGFPVSDLDNKKKI